MTHALRPVLFLCVLPLAAAAGGCAVAGAAVYKVMGPPPVPAQFVPPQRPTLVLVENYHNPSASALDAQRVSHYLIDDLQRHRVAPLVDPDRLETVRSEPDYAKMTIPAVARATGAAQVLYVNLSQLSVENTVGADMVKGKAEMSVRFVEAETGQTQWPTDLPSGYPVTVETPWTRVDDKTNPQTVRAEVSRRAATEIVKLFRKWQTDEEPMDPLD